jgi:hypothetical protein
LVRARPKRPRHPPFEPARPVRRPWQPPPRSFARATPGARAPDDAVVASPEQRAGGARNLVPEENQRGTGAGALARGPSLKKRRRRNRARFHRVRRRARAAERPGASPRASLEFAARAPPAASETAPGSERFAAGANSRTVILANARACVQTNEASQRVWRELR